MRVLAMVLAGGEGTRLWPLTEERAKPAVPFGGRYRIIDFITFARTEGRFARQFDAQGRPSSALVAAQADRLANWRRLQELAGLSGG